MSGGSVEPIGYQSCADPECGHELRQHVGVGGPCAASARCPCMRYTWAAGPDQRALGRED